VTSTPDWVCLIALALTGMVLFNVAVVEAVDTGEPAVVGTVVGLAPVGVGLLVPAVERRRPRAAIVAGAILASSGAALVQGFGDADRAALCWSGVALCCEVAFTVLAAPLLRTLSPLGLAIRACALASVMLLVAATLLEGSDGFVRPDAGEGLAIGYLAVASTSVAFVLWYCALARLGPERTGLFAGLMPISAALVGAAVTAASLRAGHRHRHDRHRDRSHRGSGFRAHQRPGVRSVDNGAHESANEWVEQFRLCHWSPFIERRIPTEQQSTSLPRGRMRTTGAILIPWLRSWRAVMPQMLGFSHINLTVTDIQAAKRFWTDVMGFVLAMEVSDFCLFLDPVSFTAVGVKDHDGTAEGAFDERRPGLDHLALSVSDVGQLTTWAEHLAAHNVEHSEIEESDLGYHLNLRAPERIPLELFVLKADAAATLTAEPTEATE
jgi:catechol 2,3-dioxygenase-like lactoylglutathione lyase family enzyme